MSKARIFPHDTHQIDLGDAVLSVLHDKIVLSPKGSEEHLTLQLGLASKRLDVHRTRRVARGLEEYKTLFTVSHEAFGSALEELTIPILNTMLKAFRPLRIGWMAKHYIGAEPVLFPGKEEVTDLMVKRKGRLFVNEPEVHDRVGKLEYLEDLLALPMGRGFALISYKNPFVPRIIGFGLRVDAARFGSNLVWCSKPKIMQAVHSMMALMAARMKIEMN